MSAIKTTALGRTEYWINDRKYVTLQNIKPSIYLQLSRSDDLPCMIGYHNNGSIETEYWYKDGLSHRDGDLPAVIHYDYHYYCHVNMQVYKKYGKVHRDNDLPAVIDYNRLGEVSAETYYKNGIEHRDGDLPTTIIYYLETQKVKCEKYIKNGLYHRINHKPARIFYRESGNIYDKGYYINDLRYDGRSKIYRQYVSFLRQVESDPDNLSIFALNIKNENDLIKYHCLDKLGLYK